jgi:hypothetical protein
VSYRVEFHASALAQYCLHRHSTLWSNGLASWSPWETLSLDRDEPSFRQGIFGGLGLLSFHVDDRRELIRTFDVTWAG